MTDTKYIIEQLDKQTKNQEKIIELLQTLIKVTASCAISDPINSVNAYTRMDAASYAKLLYEGK